VGRGQDFLSPYPSLRLAFTGIPAEDAGTAGRILGEILAEYPDLTEHADRAGVGVDAATPPA